MGRETLYVLGFIVKGMCPVAGAFAPAVNHQKEFADACATPSADQAIFDGALGMAYTVIDASQDEGVRRRLLTK